MPRLDLLVAVIALALAFVASPALSQQPPRSIYAVIGSASGANHVTLVRMNTATGASETVTDLPPNLFISSTDSDTVVSDQKGVVRIGLMDVNANPWLVTVDTVNKKVTGKVQIQNECLLWQMFYNTKSHQLFGVSVASPSNGTLFKINPTTGATTNVGTFPFEISTAELKQVKKGPTPGTCYEMLGGGTVVDPERNAVWIHFSAGSQGMYIEQVDLSSASVRYHGFFPIDFAAPAMDKNRVFSLTYDETPPYAKHLAVLDLTTRKNHVFAPVIPFEIFWANEAAFDIRGQSYSCIMTHNITQANHLVTIKDNGQVWYSPVLAASDIVWTLFAPTWEEPEHKHA